MAFEEYPKCKYNADGRCVVVDDAQAEADLGGGWGDAPPDVPVPDPVDARLSELQAELEAERAANGLPVNVRAALDAGATALGVKVDRRWGDKRLVDEIMKAAPQG